LTLGAIAAFVDYRWLARYHIPWILLTLAVVALIAVLVPGIGAKVNGARRWFRFGGQPSEFAKLAVIVALAYYAAWNRDRMSRLKEGFLIPGFIIASVSGLVFLERDWGTALLVIAVGAVMIMIGGASWKPFFLALLAGSTLLAIALCASARHFLRILAFLDLEQHKSGVGWQNWQALVALGAGGFAGRGLGEGRQKYGFVPEHETDFILTVVGEEFGFLGTGLILLLFVFILLAGVTIIWQARDSFGYLLASGITFLIGLQAFINIGVVTSSLPNKGIPLPFISYGGSDLIVMLTGVGLLINIARVSGSTK
jgi:cell division protein FtsW